MSVLRAILLVSAPLLLALGITLPLLTFEKLIFFTENPSLVGMVQSLIEHEDYLLAALVGLFSIVFPVLKLVAVAYEMTMPKGGSMGRLASLVPFLTKWSMMDVMLVAIVIAAAKTSGLADAFTEPGLWCYAGSALSTSLLQALAARRR